MALASLLAVAFTTSASGLAAESADQFEAITGGDVAAPAYTPLGLSQAPVTVMVQLSGETVAEKQGKAGRKLSDEEKAQIRDSLKGKQDGLKSSIQSLGGEVLADYQFAYNGIRVKIERNKLDQLGQLPGVLGVRPIQIFYPDNQTSVPYIGTPGVWQQPHGVAGKGIKVAVIDTGIDYTHADFGGPGTAAAFDAADATDTAPADPSLFGSRAPKVKGGTDLVGDDYNASSDDPAETTPHPDPNPLDCNGHGTHTSGTATGFGVTSDGKTYNGPYNEDTYTKNSFKIGPGVAPEADLYSVRVFGCTGSTNVTVDAIEWAVENDMDVINMSLGSPFGRADDPSAVASTNAAEAGVVVVASAGNSGPNQYITGSPASGNGAISVAANDATASFPGINIALSTGKSLVALNANDADFADGTTLPVKVLRNADGTVSLGCKHPSGGPGADGSNEWTDVAGKFVVTVRGTCARVARPIFGQKEGAAAVAMVNTDPGYPPFEGPITSNPDTGEEFTVTIPFAGVRGVLGPNPTADGDDLVAADGGTATFTNAFITNTNFSGFASFSSGGPRNGDSALKPDITAPGVSTESAAVGTGNGATRASGTSMSAPHVAGVAALVRQAHPTWTSVENLKAAIVNTGNPAAIGGTAPYRISRGGTGLVQPQKAVATEAVAVGDPGTATLSYGFEELSSNYSKTKTIKIRNLGSETVTFTPTQTNAAGSPHSVLLGAPSVTVPAGGEAELSVTLNVPVATAGNSQAAALSFREVAGLITLTPNVGQNSDVTLRVPYYFVPRALSSIGTTVANQTVRRTSPSTTATVSNGGPIAGDADFYAWGLEDANEGGSSSSDVRGIGVQSFDFPSASDPTQQLLVFAVNTHDRWSNAATNEFDIYVDVNSDRKDDYVIVGVDQGAVQAGSFNGRMAAFVFSLNSPGAAVDFFATARTDSSTALLPILSSRLCRPGEPCLSEAKEPRITYHAVSFDLDLGGSDTVSGTAKYNVWSSSISQGMFVNDLAPGASATVPVTIDGTEWNKTPAKGIMVVTLDDKSGGNEADLVAITLK